jgi:hypothetical protein
MEPLCEVRTRRLLEMSADIDKQMAELRTLRDSIRAAEATLPVPEAIEPASFALSPPEKARLTSETFSALHLSTAD